MWLFQDNNWVMPAGALIIASAVYWAWHDDDGANRQAGSQSVRQVGADAGTASARDDNYRAASEPTARHQMRYTQATDTGAMSPASWAARTGGRQTGAPAARGGQSGSSFTDARDTVSDHDARLSRDAALSAPSASSQTAGVIIQQNQAASTTAATETGNDIIPGIEDMDAQTALAEVRDLIVNDGPSGLLQLMGARLVSRDGSVLGYQINPPEGVYLDSIGIQPGDIVMEINGVALNNPDNINSIIMGLLFSTSIEMKLERDGIIETVKR